MTFDSFLAAASVWSSKTWASLTGGNGVVGLFDGYDPMILIAVGGLCGFLYGGWMRRLSGKGFEYKGAIGDFGFGMSALHAIVLVAATSANKVALIQQFRGGIFVAGVIVIMVCIDHFAKVRT